MAYKISNSCTACGNCVDSCPVEAIKVGEVYSIDGDTCIDCGACVDECAFSAISSGNSSN